MRVLGICSYPIESAATRYRLAQFVEPLAKKGIELKVSSFLDSDQFTRLYQNRSLVNKIIGLWKPLIRRFLETAGMNRYDLIVVQREAMFFGPGFFERLFQIIGKCPMVLDLDDATYIRYVSPTYGRLGSIFKFFGKTDRLIERSDAVICGNRFIAEYVEKKGRKAVVVPTVVDTDKFCPAESKNEIPIIGWVGTHSTFPLLQSIFPVLQELGKRHQFILKVVGSGQEGFELDGVVVENTPWALKKEIADFQSLDIGLYPISVSKSANEEWLKGKSGFKAIQYMAIGIPFVMTPVGVCAEIGTPDETHFNAVTDEEWYRSLDMLLSDRDLRMRMGKMGRNHVLENYTVPVQAEKLERTFKSVLENKKEVL